MSSQHLDEEAIFEVAREIQHLDIRAKYLSQVCHDERLLGRLEGRLMTARRRWQFSLRKLMVVMLLAGSGMGIVAHQAIRARQAEMMARRLAVEAREQAELAKRNAELAAIQAAAAQEQAAEQRQAEETKHD